MMKNVGNVGIAILVTLAVVLCLVPLPSSTTITSVEKRQFDANSIEQSTVLVVLEEQGSGSGVAIGSHTILTAGHCVAKDNYVVLRDGTKCKVTHAVMLSGLDAALLFVKETLPCVAKPGPDIEAPSETWVYARLLSTAGALDPNARFGWTRGVASTVSSTDLILDQAVYPGMSGGGVFTDSGQLVGIIVARLEEKHNVTKAIPIGLIMKAIAETGLGQ